jgi:hypothetical protein
MTQRFNSYFSILSLLILIGVSQVIIAQDTTKCKIKILPQYDFWEGQCVNGKANGYGMLYHGSLKSGYDFCYIGYMQDNKRNGYGIEYSNKYVIIGEWIQDTKSTKSFMYERDLIFYNGPFETPSCKGIPNGYYLTSSKWLKKISETNLETEYRIYSDSLAFYLVKDTLSPYYKGFNKIKKNEVTINLKHAFYFGARTYTHLRSNWSNFYFIQCENSNVHVLEENHSEGSTTWYVNNEEEILIWPKSGYPKRDSSFNSLKIAVDSVCGCHENKKD